MTVTILLAVISVLAWGTWLLPAQSLPGVSSPVIVFYATLANLIVAGLVALGLPGASATGLSTGVTITIALGGAAWALSGVCAFRATALLGPGRAMGIWSPLNILVSLGWGALLFREFSSASGPRLGLTALAALLLLGGLRLLLQAGDTTAPPANRQGIGWAIGAGLLWGSYFVPLRLSGASTWTVAFPMAIGTFATAALIILARRESLRLPRRTDTLRLLACGVLWSAGNYGSLLLMERIGTGRGFSVAQLCLVVNALLGIHLLHRPAPGSPAARRVLIGCGFATAGGALLGFTS